MKRLSHDPDHAEIQVTEDHADQPEPGPVVRDTTRTIQSGCAVKPRYVVWGSSLDTQTGWSWYIELVEKGSMHDNVCTYASPMECMGVRPCGKERINYNALVGGVPYENAHRGWCHLLSIHLLRFA